MQLLALLTAPFRRRPAAHHRGVYFGGNLARPFTLDPDAPIRPRTVQRLGLRPGIDRIEFDVDVRGRARRVRLVR